MLLETVNAKDLGPHWGQWRAVRTVFGVEVQTLKSSGSEEMGEWGWACVLLLLCGGQGKPEERWA